MPAGPCEIDAYEGSPARINLCMVAPAFGDSAVSRTSNSVSSRWAVIVLAAAALALAGCGRKGGLDLPPTASNQPPPGAAAANGASAANGPAAGPAGVFDPAYHASRKPVAPPGQKKSFILDPLLD